MVGASGNPALYGNLAWGGFAQGTGGSTSMTSSFTRYRQAGAVARTMLVEAAEDRVGFMIAVLELQSRLVRAA